MQQQIAQIDTLPASVSSWYREANRTEFDIDMDWLILNLVRDWNDICRQTYAELLELHRKIQLDREFIDFIADEQVCFHTWDMFFFNQSFQIIVTEWNRYMDVLCDAHWGEVHRGFIDGYYSVQRTRRDVPILIQDVPDACILEGLDVEILGRHMPVMRLRSGRSLRWQPY